MRWLAKHREAVTGIGIVALVVVVAVVSPAFAEPGNLVRVLNAAVILVLLAVGEAMVIITKNIDVSVGSVLALSGIFAAEMLIAGVSPIIVALVTCLAGTLLGAISGVFVAYGHASSIVVTLGTMAAYRGISFLITGGYSIENIPVQYSSIGAKSLFGVQVLIWACAVVVVIMALLVARSAPGRHLYAVGGNSAGAHMIGIRVKPIVVMAYAGSGLMAGMAALVYIAQVGSMSNQAGVGIEMQAVAAAVIGGVALTGGVGTVIGAAGGAVFITTATSSMSFLGVPGFWANAVVGAVLLVALFADAGIRKSMDARRLIEKYANREAATGAAR